VFDDLDWFAKCAALNFTAAIVIVRGIYYPGRRDDRAEIFSLLAFNTMTFFVLSVMRSARVDIGFGLGLFALFSLLSYRTTQLSMREMTYLFVVLALAVMNTVAVGTASMAQVLSANLAVIVIILALEKGWGFRFETSHRITYDRVDLVVPAKSEQLRADLQARTGLPIKRVEVGRIDFQRSTAEVKIYCDPSDVGSIEPADREHEAVEAPASTAYTVAGPTGARHHVQADRGLG
jgi:hypothetical protein